jgi:hypothetical protein
MDISIPIDPTHRRFLRKATDAKYSPTAQGGSPAASIP